MKALVLLSYVVLSLSSVYNLQAIRLTNLAQEIIMVNIKNARSQQVIASGCVTKDRYLELILSEPIPLIVSLEICNAIGKKIALKKKSSSLFNIQNSDELILLKSESAIALIHAKKTL